MVEGLPNINCPTEMCEDCIVGKQHRDSFPQGKAWRAEQILQLVHSDICGPINPTSNGNKRHFITFINDYSRKTWVYFLQEKSEAFIVFKSFKLELKKNLASTFRSFVQIVVVNLTRITLQVFVNCMEYGGNLLLKTHCSKMAWQKERIR